MFNIALEVHLKERGFRSIDLPQAAVLSQRRGLRPTIAWERGVLGAPPPDGSTVAS